MRSRCQVRSYGLVDRGGVPSALRLRALSCSGQKRRPAGARPGHRGNEQAASGNVGMAECTARIAQTAPRMPPAASTERRSASCHGRARDRTLRPREGAVRGMTAPISRGNFGIRPLIGSRGANPHQATASTPLHGFLVSRRAGRKPPTHRLTGQRARIPSNRIARNQRVSRAGGPENSRALHSGADGWETGGKQSWRADRGSSSWMRRRTAATRCTAISFARSIGAPWPRESAARKCGPPFIRSRIGISWSASPFEFHQRWFEMYLGASLMSAGIDIRAPKPGTRLRSQRRLSADLHRGRGPDPGESGTRGCRARAGL